MNGEDDLGKQGLATTSGAGRYAVLIPAYNPDQRLVEIVAELGAMAGPVVVVDDGSAAASWPVFDQISRREAVTLLRHEVNRGKGSAIKTGLGHIARTRPDLHGVVLMDADGQHAVEDLRRVGDLLEPNDRRLVIGVRSEVAARAPLRSRLGNAAIGFLFARLTGRRLLDTQTGLRAIPSSLFPDFLALAGTRYEYEMEMLCFCCARGIPIVETPIETRYLDDNRASHFNPPVDSSKIVWALLRYGLRRRRRAAVKPE